MHCACSSHAFKQLFIAQEERRHLGCKAMGGYLCYKTGMFRVRSGPLVGGRVAALLLRLTFAMLNKAAFVRIQCFMDDPLTTVGRTKLVRDRILLHIVLLCLVWWFKLSWKKGCRGREVEWIGALLRAWQSSTGVAGVTISITAGEIKKLASTCQGLLQSGERVPKGRLRQVAGLAAWISGVMPQMSAYTAMIWAALRTGSTTTEARSQVTRPLKWLFALCSTNARLVERHCRRRSQLLRAYNM